MNAIHVFIVGISIVFFTLGMLAAFTYLAGKMLLLAGGKKEGGREVAAIVAKLHGEGKL